MKKFAEDITSGKRMLNQDFKEFIELLNANNVRYLVVGGYAVALHGYPPNRIDLITSLTGVDLYACYQTRVEVDVEDVMVDFIDVENLKTNKQASARPQDLADLDNLD